MPKLIRVRTIHFIYIDMNVIFDGNYLFHKTLGAFKMMREADKTEDLNMTELFAEKEDQAMFFRKIVTDFCNTVRIFDDVDKVVFTFDSPSWRKKMNPSYKYKEKDEIQKMLDKESEAGWTMFYEIMEKFSKHVEKLGFPVSRLLDFEGDDLCFFYGTYYSAINEKTVVISGDKDLLQFIDKNISVFRNNSMSPAYFCVDNEFSNKVADSIIKRYKKTVVKITDPIKHTFVKMLMGDKGDCVDNLFKGLGEKTAEKVFSLARENGFDDLRYDEDDYLKGLCEIIKIVSKKAPKDEELIEKLKSNVKLMWLDDSVYTKNQLEAATEEVIKKAHSYTYKAEFNLTDIIK